MQFYFYKEKSKALNIEGNQGVEFQVAKGEGD
jgi:hypothetical protein